MIKISGVQIKEPLPQNFTIERYNLTKSGRTASGLMTMDLIAKKRKLKIKYDVISGEDMDLIFSLIDDPKKMFFKVEWDEPTGIKSAMCYVGAIPTTYFRRHMGFYWKDVTFDLIEQ